MHLCKEVYNSALFLRKPQENPGIGWKKGKPGYINPGYDHLNQALFFLIKIAFETVKSF
jgi:hypothetical protein